MTVTTRAPQEMRDLKNEFAYRLGFRTDNVIRGPKSTPSAQIVGVGFGVKWCRGEVVAEEALQVFVRTKIAARRLRPSELVPAEVMGLPTDVIAVGDVTPARRPVECGVSAAHYRVPDGTLGCVVERKGDPERYLLSCNHVFADTNAGVVGDEILEPASANGGSSNSPIATLFDFEPIKFAAHRQDTSHPNTIDAALAKLHNPADVRHTFTGGMTFNSLATTAFGGLDVEKVGQKTNWTKGRIYSSVADIMVDMGGGRWAFFEDQIISGPQPHDPPFALRGDSGAIVFSQNGQHPVGMILAVASASSNVWATPIDALLSRFQVDIVCA